MKTTPFFLIPALSLGFFLTSVRAEDPVPVQIPPVVRALLSDLLKPDGAPKDGAPKDGAAKTDDQNEKLQALLVSLLKTLSQMLPELIASLDTASASSGSTASAPSDFNLSALLGLPAPSAPAGKPVVEMGLRSSSLVTGGLGSGGAAAMNDEEWKLLFQRRTPRR